MASTEPNRHGLKRYIPQDIRQAIRKNSGYGCVICGSMFCDYEHIEPEFHNATEHDPECMTLLCGGCHHHVTGRRKSKRNVWKAKSSPFAIERGYVRESIEPTIEQQIRLGNSFVDSTQIVLEIHGKPILWFEKPSEPDEPILVNAIFYDSKGNPQAFINRNQFTAAVGDCDIKSEGTSIEFRPKPGKISLILNVEADEPISINRLDMHYFGTGFQVLPNKSMYLTSGDSNISLSNMTVSNCGAAFGFGSIPRTRSFPLGTIKRLEIAYAIARKTIYFENTNGQKLGWLSGNLVVDKNYNFVAKLEHIDASKIGIENLFGEFVGYLHQHSSSSFSVEMPEPEYETYEPIWQNPMFYKTRFLRVRNTYDLSHRLFGQR
ncbi:hypothetical protein [Vibrio coralliirubri]|uniref:hypothetical protein n=1 Tax=Vibrio coralliirubri TaxID=1516159 RepID=UPI0006339733|nr:hypothetical protein [Vibrio coralliirubri]CDT18883.1 conserved hypothetical protein [Vibrio coralliirubri]